MKRNSIITLLFIFACIFSACNGFLSVEPEDSIAMGEFYKTEANIRQNTASLYTMKSWSAFSHQFMWMAGDELSGDLYYTYDQEGQFYYMSFGANNTFLTQGWQGLYRIISFAKKMAKRNVARVQKHSVCGRRDSGIFNSSHATNSV